MIYENYGASTTDALEAALGPLLDILRRYEREADPTKYFMERVRRSFHSSPADIKLIGNTLFFANEAHRYQQRLTGKPYIIHPISAAAIIFEYLEINDAIMVAGALGHDIREDHGKIWSRWHVRERTNTSVAQIISWCNRNDYAEIEDRRKRDDAFLGNILREGPPEVRIVKSAEKLHNNLTPAPEKLADPKWRERKVGTIEKWYEPITRSTGFLVEEMTASRIAIENKICLLT